MPPHSKTRGDDWLIPRALPSAVNVSENAGKLTADGCIRLKRQPFKFLFKPLFHSMDCDACEVRLQLKVAALLDTDMRVARTVTDRVAAKFDRDFPNVPDELPFLFEERMSSGGGQQHECTAIPDVLDVCLSGRFSS